jgi:hypothetical protein
MQTVKSWKRNSTKKGLPEGAVATPVAGYLYFPLAKRAKSARYELEYVLNGSKVVLRLAE